MYNNSKPVLSRQNAFIDMTNRPKSPSHQKRHFPDNILWAPKKKRVSTISSNNDNEIQNNSFSNNTWIPQNSINTTENDQFIQSQYRGYEMTFFKDNIYYNFLDPVKLVKSVYNYEMDDVSERDIDGLKDIFSKIVSTNVIGKRLFIRPGLCKITDNCSNILMTIPDDENWNLSIHVQGVKCKDGIYSPVWKLYSASQCREIL